MKGFVREKNRGGAFSWIRRRHEAELEQNQSRAPAGTSCRGNFPPGGGNRRHRHHQHSSHQRGLVTINIFISTISSPNPSSSLVRLLVVLITLVVDASWITWWKSLCSDPWCYSLHLWSWLWLCFVNSYFCSWGHGISHADNSHVNLVFVRYFDEMYVVFSSSGVMWTSSTWHFTIIWA